MEITIEDVIRTGPGTPAGRYLRSFWQPVMRSADLAPGTALPLRIMGEDFTVFRTESGVAQVAAPRCPHRLTRLHTGTIAGEHIRCLYHGWAFDTSGQCVHQPGERESFTRGTRIASYPTTEYLGLVWAYLGEGEAPTMRRFPDFERSGFLSVGLPERWPCNYFNRMDNITDIAHVLTTHKETMSREDLRPRGLEDASVVPEMNFSETEFGVHTTVKGRSGVMSHFHFLMPNANAIAASVGRVEGYRDGTRHWRAEMFFRVPVDDDSCISFSLSLIDVFGEEAERLRAQRDQARAELDPHALIVGTAEAVLKGSMRIRDMDQRMSAFYSFLVEDYVCQVGQGPIADRAHERLGQIDRGTVMMRKIFMREVAAFARGEPTRKWVVPAGLMDMTQPQPSHVREQALASAK